MRAPRAYQTDWWVSNRGTCTRMKVSVYENTSAEAQDSMAIMFLYMLDQAFIRPKLDRRE